VLAGPGWPPRVRAAPRREKESQNENADPQTQQAPSHHAAFAERAALHGIEDKFSGVGEKALQSGSLLL